MQSNNALYNHTDSIARMDDILAASDQDYQEVDEIPSRDRLTFKNGFYVNKCAALFIDLRGSSELPSRYNRPTLARIYRAFLSECAAVINANMKCAEVNIHGDAVWGVFSVPFKSDVDGVFATAYMLNSLVKSLNCRLKKKKIDPLRVGIGVSFGRALMIKAGYKGYALNEVVWMGDVVNDAAHLCRNANKMFNQVIMVSKDIYSNLNEANRALLYYNGTHNCYHGDVVSSDMEKWWLQNCAGA